jgi:hypothetical protein
MTEPSGGVKGCLALFILIIHVDTSFDEDADNADEVRFDGKG